MYRRHRRDHVTSRMRYRGHDYGAPGMYFVTICTKGRRELFGSIEDLGFIPSIAGTVIDSWWHTIPLRFPDVTLDSVVVRPNHLHAVLGIGMSDRHGASEPLPELSDVVQWFKGVTTNDYMLGVRRYGWPRFERRLWQKGYYDHIVRDERDLARIRGYIEANPANWAKDEYRLG